MILKIKLSTYLSLGIKNLLIIAICRFFILNFFKVFRKKHQFIISGNFFESNELCKKNTSLGKLPPYKAFGWIKQTSNKNFIWNKNIYTDSTFNHFDTHWTRLRDDYPEDIKAIWELSRFDWAPCLASQYLNGNRESINELNYLISDWCTQNKPFNGANWMCGQEASLRVINLALTSIILGNKNIFNDSLKSFIRMHLKRILPTIFYALAQDNNHGTSEGAALFIGGSWLRKFGFYDGVLYETIGRKILENRANKLIDFDGTFSQYSINYHRLMLDTYSIVELWRRKLDLKIFTTNFFFKLSLAVSWLNKMMLPSGLTPNIGHNDGSYLLKFSGYDYRDYRPSVNLASTIFCSDNKSKILCSYELLNSLRPEEAYQPIDNNKFHHLLNGGFMIHRIGEDGLLLFNYPRYKFRPSQNDAMHVDLWINGENILRDGGTYSYNLGDKYVNYFSGSESHNTIQFDNEEPMPRLSKFLLGNWLKSSQVKFNAGTNYEAKYTDHKGRSHHRKIFFSNEGIKIIDSVKGFETKAVMRWRLKPDEWKIKGKEISTPHHSFNVFSTVDINRFELKHGMESLYYLKKETIPVLEVEISKDGDFITEYYFR